LKPVAFLVAACLALSVHAADKPATRAPAKAAPAKPAAAKPAAAKPAAATATAVIPVKGMSCGGCVAHVNEALGKLAGVKSVDTSLDDAKTTVVYDPAKVKPEQISKAISAAGYEPGTPAVK
jgi:copper ion binding protein